MSRWDIYRKADELQTLQDDRFLKIVTGGHSLIRQSDKQEQYLPEILSNDDKTLSINPVYLINSASESKTSSIGVAVASDSILEQKKLFHR